MNDHDHASRAAPWGPPAPVVPAPMPMPSPSPDRTWPVVVAILVAIVLAVPAVAFVVDRAVRRDEGSRPPVGLSAATSSTVGMADSCAETNAALSSVDAVTSDGTKALQGPLVESAARLRRAEVDAVADVRAELEMLAVSFVGIADAIDALDRLRQTADDERRGVIDGAADALPLIVDTTVQASVLASTFPALAAACALTPRLSWVTEHDVSAVVDSLRRFLSTSLVDEPDLEVLRSVAENIVAGFDKANTASSKLTAEFAQCLDDRRADGLGDDPGCDALQAACSARDLLACNDLYYASMPGSAYERYGSSCGERVTVGADAYAGFCERLDEP